MDVRANRSRISVEEKLEILLKLDNEVRVAHGYNSNEKNGLSQEGITRTAMFNNLSNVNIKTEHDPTGLGRWTFLRIQGTEVVYRRLGSDFIPCHSSKALGG